MKILSLEKYFQADKRKTPFIGMYKLEWMKIGWAMRQDKF